MEKICVFGFKCKIFFQCVDDDAILKMRKDIIQKTSRLSRTLTGTSLSGSKNLDNGRIVFDTVDSDAQLTFLKYYQRKVKSSRTAVVTLQDVKDVAIFTTKIGRLFPEFITFFHTISIDRFLRSMIVYFQYYLLVWNKMQLRKKEAARKLRQPIVTQLENEVRDNLADLRSMIARNYAGILMGIGDIKKLHHMNNNVSLSNKDRRIFETLIFMTTKVVWIALFRKNYSLIDKEINRLMRTIKYSPVEHAGNCTLESTLEEEKILLGTTFKTKKKHLLRSPAIQEIIFNDHDYRFLSIGINNIPAEDKRIRYLELALAAPEEILEGSSIAIGVLGVRRRYLDAMLNPKELFTTDETSSLVKVGDFSIPPKPPFRYLLVCDTLSRQSCQFQETEETKKARITQCKMWRTYLEMEGITPKSEVEFHGTPPGIPKEPKVDLQAVVFYHSWKQAISRC
ncbi:protein phosphatase 1 regulatory subunit 36-like [Euwallacea fornicatus]|uniref:protein phosphatase 1 regulatory subunit 36-like n=1 Tax=Euwallacea fornicatus TaxID=995702 RepID=UPI00338D6303